MGGGGGSERKTVWHRLTILTNEMGILGVVACALILINYVPMQDWDIRCVCRCFNSH